MTRALTIAVAAACCILAGAAPAGAAGRSTCARTGAVSQGTVLKLAGGGKARSLSRGPYYVTTGHATLHFDGAVYKVAADTIFELACSGAAGGAADMPAVNVEMGSASVKTGGAATYGTLSSNEMLLDPYAGRKMGMKLTRTPKGDPTIESVVREGPQGLGLGKTVGKQIGGKGAYLNITPYVGSAASTNGLCHQAHGATTNTTELKNRYPQGTVTYQGLASFSPR